MQTETASFNLDRFQAPFWVAKKQAEELFQKKIRTYYAGFEADPTVICLLSWRWDCSDPKNIVYAGLPTKETFKSLLELNQILTFTPMLMTLHGKELPQEVRKAKVIRIEPGYSSQFDFNLTLEIVRETAETVETETKEVE